MKGYWRVMSINYLEMGGAVDLTSPVALYEPASFCPVANARRQGTIVLTGNATRSIGFQSSLANLALLVRGEHASV
jgi:hypothetical protein